MSFKGVLFEKIRGKVLLDEPMRNHTTLNIGGPADILVSPKDLEDIRYCITYTKEKGIPLTVIGNGSKILVSDKGIRGKVIKIAKTFDHVKVLNDRMIVGAGCSLSKILEKAIQSSLSGLEFAAGIPGTLGGAIAMNAGTYLGSVSDVADKVTAINTETNTLVTLSKKECDFNYRRSIFQRAPLIIVSAELCLAPGNKDEINRKIKELLAKRAKTPLDKPNAGSIFRNPPMLAAGKLIDSAGLKGTKIGGAQISEKHANFIVNLGNAKAEDVYALIRLAQKEVKAKYGINLALELRIIGEW